MEEIRSSTPDFLKAVQKEYSENSSLASDDEDCSCFCCFPCHQRARVTPIMQAQPPSPTPSDIDSEPTFIESMLGAELPRDALYFTTDKPDKMVANIKWLLEQYTLPTHGQLLSDIYTTLANLNDEVRRSDDGENKGVAYIITNDGDEGMHSLAAFYGPHRDRDAPYKYSRVICGTRFNIHDKSEAEARRGRSFDTYANDHFGSLLVRLDNVLGRSSVR